MFKNADISREIKRGEEEGIWIALTDVVYVFKHALIREAIYEMQLKKTLRSFHKLAAETMERLYQDKIELHYGEVAHHFWQGWS